MRHELEAYGHGLADKPEIVALSKIDALDDETRAEKLAALQAVSASPVMALSAVSGEGVPNALRAIMTAIGKAREEADDDA